MLVFIKKKLNTIYYRKDIKLIITLMILALFIVAISQLLSYSKTPNKYISLVDTQMSKAIAYQKKVLTSGKIVNSKSSTIYSAISGNIYQVLFNLNDVIEKNQALCLVGNKNKIKMLLNKKQELIQQKHNVEKHSTNGKKHNILKTLDKQIILIDKNLNKFTVRSNFTGMLAESFITENMAIKYNDKIATIIDLNHVNLVAEIDAEYINDISLDSSVIIDNNIKGKITRINNVINSNNTFIVTIEPENNHNLTLNNYANIQIYGNNIVAHRVNWSSIVINSDESMSIKAIDHNKKIVEYPIKIVAHDENGIWISGLPNKVNIIILGKNIIEPGNVMYREITKRNI